MEQTAVKSDNTIILKGLILTGALLLVVFVGAQFLSALKLSMGLRFFITRIVFWVWLAIIYIYVAKKERQPFLLWPEKAYSFGFYILSVIGILLLILILAATTVVILRPFGLLKASAAFSLMRNLSIPLKLLGIITAGVVEELIFRGYLIPRLMKFFKNEHLPIIISTLLFGLMHYGYGTLINVLIPIIIGFVFAYHYYKYRNLKILIICHLLIDLNALFTTLGKH